MSVARGKGQNGGHFYSNITQPFECDLVFTVDSTNGNGLGVRTIKSNGYVQNVFMHTSATPGRGLGNYLNPNPASGYALIQFKNNFNYYLGGFSGFASQLSGTPISISAGLTIGNPYVITSVGTSSQANFQAVGLPPGLVPTVGQSFTATSSAAGSGTGVVQAPAAAGSGVLALDIIGDPNQSINNQNIAANGGAWVLVRFLASATSGATAPANNSTCGMTFKFDCSSVSIPDGGPSNSGSGGL